jgi:hypothetical protein
MQKLPMVSAGSSANGLANKGLSKRRKRSWVQWLMPVIPATEEAEIRRIEVRSQPGQTAHNTLSQKYPTQKERMVEWFKV